jgi:phospholipid/cholesterol/gamma-HCH transport system permease protein
LTDMPSLIANEEGSGALVARGAWTVANVELLERLCTSALPKGRIDLGGVTALDTVGAWLFEKLARSGATDSTEAVFVGASPSYSALLHEVRELNRGEPGRRRDGSFVDRLSKTSRDLAAESMAFLHMLGAISVALSGVLRRPRSFRLTSTVYQLGRVGWQAIPTWRSSLS